MACNKDPTAPFVYFLSCQLVEYTDDSLPVGRSSSGDSLFIGNDGFVKVLLAQNTGLLVGLDCVGTDSQLDSISEVNGAYETESISISPPMYRDKSPIASAL